MKDRIDKIKKVSEKLIETPCARIALLWEELSNNRVRCNLCERHCIIPEGLRGMCGARYNHGGELYTLTYGNISSISNNPMAKKPFHNFYPDKYALTIGSWGCNFTCPWCQNWEISKTWAVSCNFLSPEKFIKLLKRYNSSGTSFSFNEPSVTLFEYSLDVMPLAKKLGFFNTYVTNGYFTSEAAELLVKHGLDAVNIDIKGCNPLIIRWTGADVEKVWRNAIFLKQNGVHVEITTLIIPNVNDHEDCLRSIAVKIREYLGKDTPWHVTRYYAEYKALKYGLPSATPTEILEKAWKIGRNEGLEYVYIGNVLGHPYENTYCPRCNKLLIKRSGLWNVRILFSGKYCPACGYAVNVVTG